MATAYFDCFAGAGGDMIVGALLDTGCDLEAMKAALARLPVGECNLTARKVTRGGIAGTQFNVEAPPEQPHRHLHGILSIIDAAALPPRAADRAKRVFQRLGQAEAKVHGVGIEEVHFHEVGAVDSIMDIVGSCLAMELLGIESLCCSALPTGSGTVRTAHGLLPVPAPATAELLVGAAIAESDLTGEALTPTAAALLTTLTSSYGPPPAMAVRRIGYGAGTRDPAGRPNLLRVYVGEPAEAGEIDSVVELACNLDDCTGQVLGATMEDLFLAGCLDAWASPITMKKSRPAYLLSVLCSPADVGKMEDILFRETPTLGVRRHAAQRTKLIRRHETVETPYGPIRIKIGRRGPSDVTASPEFADCRSAAQSHHVSLREVMQVSMETYRKAKP
jgi:pyridinium-3,5-bisthiocarboxylic acid mononucleotide nickel chelatase